MGFGEVAVKNIILSERRLGYVLFWTFIKLCCKGY